MPLFKKQESSLKLVKPAKFSNEKELQNLIEANLKEIFNFRFVATEFVTGQVSAGRIDTLAISEDNNPVIIEYKVTESSSVINQSLFYLDWMVDHHGDYEIAVQKAYPQEKINIDWSDIIVICITPNYKKYDLKAVQRIGENIELWRYRYYEDGSLYFDLIFRNPIKKERPSLSCGIACDNKQKEDIEDVKEEYYVSSFTSKLSPTKLNLFHEIQDFINGLDDTVEEVPKKLYIAYKTTQNVVCIETHKNKVVLYLKLDPLNIPDLPSICRDVTKIGHYGTGNLELTISKDEDIEIAKMYITKAFENLGGN